MEPSSDTFTRLIYWQGEEREETYSEDGQALRENEENEEEYSFETNRNTSSAIPSSSACYPELDRMRLQVSAYKSPTIKSSGPVISTLSSPCLKNPTLLYPLTLHSDEPLSQPCSLPSPSTNNQIFDDDSCSIPPISDQSSHSVSPAQDLTLEMHEILRFDDDQEYPINHSLPAPQHPSQGSLSPLMGVSFDPEGHIGGIMEEITQDVNPNAGTQESSFDDNQLNQQINSFNDNSASKDTGVFSFGESESLVQQQTVSASLSGTQQPSRFSGALSFGETQSTTKESTINESTKANSNSFGGLTFEDSDDETHAQPCLQSPPPRTQQPFGGLSFESDSDQEILTRPHESVFDDERQATQPDEYALEDLIDDEINLEDLISQSPKRPRHQEIASQEDQGFFLDDTAAVARFARGVLERNKQRQRMRMLVGEAGNQGGGELMRARYTALTKDFTRIPDGGGFVVGKTSGGERLYFGKKKKRDTTADVGVVAGRSQLLKVPIHVMMRNLERQLVKEATEKSELEEVMEVDENVTVDENVIVDADKGSLWVNKYAPKNYIDLIGDQTDNRHVLNWVKQWDFCVFRKKKVDRNAPKVSKDKRFMVRKSVGANEVVDPLDRPEKRILLLNGRAGLGKTTLAHIVAKHSGYNVVEINASDDRTAAALKNKLMGAITSTNVSNGKPNLVIIDEIDGASATGGDCSFVKYLIDLITAETKVSTMQNMNSKHIVDNNPTFKKKKKKVQRLLRPIICICNDQYAAVLRQLRPYCQIITFATPPPLQPLAKRLDQVCINENLRADMHSLMALCEAAEGDIRSCLNTLQFIFQNSGKMSRDGKVVLTLDMLQTMDIGNKDMQKGLFSIWDSIFNVKDISDKRSGFGNSEKGETGIEDTDKLYSIITGNGDYDKIMQGCFENYLLTKNPDTFGIRTNPNNPSSFDNNSKIEQALEWISYYDILNSRIGRGNGNEWQLYSYLPFVFIQFHRLFSSVKRLKAFVARKNFEGILGDLTNNGMDNNTRRLWGSSSLTNNQTSFNLSNGAHSLIAMDLVPYLYRIISPNLKKVNIHMIKPHEKEILDRLVGVMLTHGLSFYQTKTDDCSYAYVLNPPIEELIAFSKLDYKQSSKPHVMVVGNMIVKKVDVEKKYIPSTYVMRQLISQEIEKERLIRSEDIQKTKRAIGVPEKDPALKSKEDKEKDAEKAKIEAKRRKDFLDARIIDHAASQVKPVDVKPLKDFFGRDIALPDQTDVNVEEEQEKVCIVYKFHEGFTDAVRKPVSIEEFFFQ